MPDLRRGFTIFELVVSIGIMLAITTVIAFNQTHYTSGAELKNLANDLSLSLRQAQIYGISVKQFTSAPGDVSFNVGYGVEFNTLAAPDGGQSYIFFADRGTEDGVYNNSWACPIGGESECVDKTTLGARNHIETLCVIDSSGNEGCNGITRLDITFVRPSSDAHIIANGDGPGSAGLKGAEIKLSSDDGKENMVTIYVTGQISVQ